MLSGLALTGLATNITNAKAVVFAANTEKVSELNLNK